VGFRGAKERKKQVSNKYLDMMKDINDGTITRVSTIGGKIEPFCLSP